MKYCSKCQLNKENTSFYRSKRTKDGLRCHCKECSQKSRKEEKLKKNYERWEREKVVDLDGEIWKNITGYESHYQVSNLGRVKNISQIRRVSMLLTPSISNGYHSVVLSGYGSKKNRKYLLHRLVAIHFISNPNNLKIVHHRDHNKINNNVNNLIWTTHRKNMEFASKSNRMKRHDLVNKQKRTAPKETVPSYYTDINFKPSDEVWVDVKDFNGIYKISNYGRIISYNKNKNGKFLKPKLLLCRTSKTPLLHGLSRNKKDISITVHRLVATHFIENPNNLPEINHKDYNKHNNHISNLEWITHKDNIKHAVENGLTNRGERSFLSKLTEKQVLEIRHKNETEDISINKLALLYNVKHNTIKSILVRNTWKHI